MGIRPGPQSVRSLSVVRERSLVERDHRRERRTLRIWKRTLSYIDRANARPCPHGWPGACKVHSAFGSTKRERSNGEIRHEWHRTVEQVARWRSGNHVSGPGGSYGGVTADF